MNKKILHRVFEHTAEKFPERVAVEETGKERHQEEQQEKQQNSITYRELNAKANKTARSLQEIGVKEGVVVGLRLPAGIDYIIAALAVLKAGGIFMPLDADAPPKRLKFMLKKTEPHIIVNSDKSLTILNRDDCPTVNLEIDKFSDANLEFTPDPQSANYIIFTSGSTGEPKAILGKHVSLSHFIHWEISAFGFDENVRASLFAPTTFDVSFRDIFVPLLCGGTVCIPEPETMRNTPRLVDWLESSRITLVHCVPTMFRLILKELKARKDIYELSKTTDKSHKNLDNEYKSQNIHYNPLPEMQNILLAGEALYGSDVIEWIDLAGERIKLTNLYGPSETTLAKIHYRIKDKPSEPNRIIPLGEPITNTAVLILKDNRLCKVGEIGEIHIKTPFCSHGYYKEPELTAQSFIQNPLTADPDIIYKTGDLGRYLQDHQVEFIGRLDSQVKINGIRIELSEIESHLFAHKAIERPVVVAHAAAEHESKLVCYYTLKDSVQSLKERDSVNSMKSENRDNDSESVENIDVTPASLRAYLSDFLPSYMIPSFFVRLNEFPLNLNGKIDRRRLPKPEDLLYDRIPYAPPSNKQEQKLAAIFSEVLGIDKVGVNTPFFDLGGNSLNAIRIISRIFAEFRVEIAIRDFFENPSIGQLSRLLDDSSKINVNKTKGVSAIDNSFMNIQPVPLAEHYPVSHAQRRLWIFEQLDPDFIAYNIPGAYLIKGRLDVDNFIKAFRAVIKRHESLRTTFKVIDGEPRQIIHQDVDFELPVQDFTQISFDSTRPIKTIKAADNQYTSPAIQQIKAILSQDAATAFDLEKGPLIRANLFKVDEGYVVGINVHHIVTDAISQDIFIRELLSFYQTFTSGETLSLPPLKIHYKDYAAWHSIQEQGAKMQTAKKYWHSQLSGQLPILNLPTDRPRPMMQTNHGDRFQFEVDPDVYRRLVDFGQQNNATIFMVITSILKILLYRYTGQEDIIIGTPIASRTHVDLENQIGLYINMLALRDKISSMDSSTIFLSKIRQTCIEAFEHQIYPFDRLVGDLAIERDFSRNVGFDVMLVMHDQHQYTYTSQGLKAEPLEFLNPTAKYDLTFTFNARKDNLLFEIEYNTDLFLPERIMRMAAHFSTLASSVLADPYMPLESLEIMPPEERELVVFGFNQTDIPYPKDRTVTELVEEYAAKYPNDPAVAFEDKILSYHELNYFANLIAHKLLTDFDLKNEEVAAVIMEKSHLAPAAMFGVLKTGAAYVGINLSNPPERIRFILNDADCRVILTDSRVIADKLNGIEDICPIINVPEFLSEASKNISSKYIANPNVPSKSSDLAFVIYTSGSTGLPKGTLLEHRQMMRLIYKPNGVVLARGDRMAQTTAFSFDVHVFEIWGGLINGCCVCIPNESAIVEPPRMRDYILGHKIKTMWLTTSLFNQFVEADITMFQELEQLLVGGEKLSTPHINRVKERYPHIRVFNGYGPTENSIYTTLFEITKLYQNDIPIGNPSANCKITILDINEQPVPIGIPGEMCVWGDGLCRGYLNRPDLNETKFCTHPLFPSERMYRIGDMGNWDSEGILHYFGRNDDQVKVRGYRIELGEITNALMEHPDIQQAVVLVRTLADGFNKEIAAYFTADRESLKQLNAQTLRNFLAQRLPGYMIPAHFVGMERMPLNPSGKVDRTHLPAPDTVLHSLESETDIAAPRTPVEETLVKVWKKILGLSEISIFDNYFNLGGDSIKAIQMVSLLARENYTVEVREIFQNPTIADLARYIRPAKILAEQTPVSGVVPLTPIQEWFFANHRTSRHHFNQAQLILSSEPMNPDALKKALIAVQNHHDALRMTYKITEEMVIQENQDINFPVDFEFVDLTNVDLANTINPLNVLDKITNDVQSNINLSTGPLMKSRLIRMPEGDRLLLVLHHLIVDGVSWRILAEDIHTAYNQIKSGESVKLPAKTHSFKAWAEKINQFALDSTLGLKLNEEIDYWQQIENYKIPALPFSCGDSAAQIQIASNGEVYQRDTDTLNITLDAEHTEKLLGTVHQTLRTQTNDILLTALARALSAWHGQPASRILLEGHGREEIFKDIDINRTVGWFTTIYPVILELPENSDDISYQVKHIKETLRKIPNNGFGYGILRYLAQKLEKSTLPAISFNYLGRFDTDIAQGFSIASESSGQCISDDVEITQDIDINAIVTEKGLEISLTYNTKALAKDSMQNLLEKFKSELETIIEHLISKAETALTPSDIDFDGLGIDELDKVLDGIG
ncbi:MAG: amino acid adenylation domain-containing protein [Desulfamplus sp.]